jgi:hypothetical protein
VIGIVVVFVVLLVAGAAWLILAPRGSRRGVQAGPTSGPSVVVSGGRATIILDLRYADPTAPACERLVHDTAARLLALLPDVDEVEVRATGGGVLGRSSRTVPRPRSIWLPELLQEPHVPRAHRPDPPGHSDDNELLALLAAVPGRPALATQAGPEMGRRRAILDRFDLPNEVRMRAGQDPDEVDVIRAILETGGHRVEADGDLLTLEDLAIVVIRPPDTAGHDALNRAYHRILDSGKARGLVVAPGLIDPLEIRRRELLVPEVLHVGPSAVQRMADAVALGGDPIRFAVAPALAASAGRP